MYHVELRQFPHSLCRFNLTDQELNAIAVPWSRGDWLDMGERKWSPHQAKLTILEGERLPVEQLSIGLGWRNARRQSEDVTTCVLAVAKEADDVAKGSADARGPAELTGGTVLVESESDDAAISTPAHAAFSDGELVIDSLGPDLVRLLGDDSAWLSRAWRAASEDSPDRSASECLALAEEAVGSSKRR